MSLKQRIAALIVLLAIAGCTTTNQGKSIDRGQYSDMATTFLALTVTTATESNPLGLALIPLKMGIGNYVEGASRNCEERTQAAKILNTLSYGFSGNNLAVALGASQAPAVGVVVAMIYLAKHKEIEPDTYDCRE